MVAAALARSLSPPEDPIPPPRWLLPEQRPSFGRVLAAVHRYGGALLADPVGSGKTFVALASAAAINRGPTACLVPATLVPQWQSTADRLGISVVLCSHEQISRGQLPHGAGKLAVIDESHHFRNPATRRYGYLAPWLVGRRALLVTATPVVNSLLDLAHQLLLTVRDDALAWDGVASLRAMLDAQRSVPALGQLVVETEKVSSTRPEKVRSQILPTGTPAALAPEIEMLDRLRLSTSPPIATLIRGVLLRSLGSSPAAFEGALRRYRRLLLHARDALQAGRVFDRSELRLFTGELGDQLIWWELLPRNQVQSDIALTDLETITALIHHVESAVREPDEKLARLSALLHDNRPTLVFTISRDTVRYIRQQLTNLRLAWCTGDRAGIGSTTLPRSSVLESFQRPADSSLAPAHLIVTDVAAEGLDLQRAARVVHYDLPWTAMRIDQREGRSVRHGSCYSQVDVVRFAVPAELERRLGVEGAVARKAGLPAVVGLGPGGGRIWRWRAELAARFDDASARYGTALVPGPPGLLAGFSLCLPGEAIPLSAAVIWMEPTGAWTESPETIAEKLATAADQTGILHGEPEAVREWTAHLTGPIRERLAQVRRHRWIMTSPSSGSRHVMSRLQRLIAEAARCRQARRLAELERALAAVTGGHTAGEAMLLQELARAGDRELTVRLESLPVRQPAWQGLDIRLTGMIVFGPADNTGPE